MNRFTAVHAKLVSIALLLGCWSPPAKAETYVNVDCGCDPKTEGRELPPNSEVAFGCVCTTSRTLGKLETKEFRFRCKSANAATPAYPYIVNRDKPTTCTIVGIDPGFYDYSSQSCTNWSTLSDDTLKLQTVCPLK